MLELENVKIVCVKTVW